MARPARYLAVCDISNDKERTKVSKVLEGFGSRIQESVFECYLSAHLRETLLRKVRTLDLQTGCLLVYRLHADSAPYGVGSCPEERGEEFAFVI